MNTFFSEDARGAGHPAALNNASAIPSRVGRADVRLFPLAQLLKWRMDTNKRESKIPSKPDRRGQTSARAISEAPLCQ